MWCDQRVEYWAADVLNWMRKYYSPNLLRGINMIIICAKQRRETLGTCNDEAAQYSTIDDPVNDVDYFCVNIVKKIDRCCPIKQWKRTTHACWRSSANLAKWSPNLFLGHLPA